MPKRVSFSQQQPLEAYSLERIGDRAYAMAALRSCAILVAVFGHAAVSYMRTPVPGLLWPVHDPSSSYVFDGLCLWAQVTAMPTFFFMAGYFATGLYESRGPRGFIRQRMVKVLGPFAAGCVFILPITYYVWSYGWLVSGTCTLKEILAVKFSPPIHGNLWGPAHMWFLEYLFLLSLAYCALRLSPLGQA